MKPFGIISDTHHHAWSAFSTVLPSGINSRLDMLLKETHRCADEVREAGGDTIFHAGDLFHVRGSLAPSVLNPTLDCYKSLIVRGFKIVILAGNHDLEGKESNRVSSAITALEGVGCRVVNKTTYDMGGAAQMVMIPWTPVIAELKALIEMVDPADRAGCDLIIHAPLDGVIPGIPDHGLDPAWLAKLGFKRIFAGHYHHHKDFGGGVHSIGALAHHTWSDIGTKAGFLVVSETAVKWHKSHAPEFVEITAETDIEEIPLIVDGNFVRAKINSSDAGDVRELREHLLDSGAKGVVILSQKKSSVEPRTGETITAGASLEVSVNDYIKAQKFADEAKLAILCGEIMGEVRATE